MKINSEPIYQYVLVNGKIEIIKYSSIYVGDAHRNGDEYKIYGKPIFGVINPEFFRLTTDKLYISREILNKRYNHCTIYNMMFSFERNNEITFINETIKYIEDMNKVLDNSIRSDKAFLKAMEEAKPSARSLALTSKTSDNMHTKITRLTRNNMFIDFLRNLRSQYENKEGKINGCN